MDRQIDRLVYGLYGLTAAEVEVVKTSEPYILNRQFSGVGEYTAILSLSKVSLWNACSGASGMPLCDPWSLREKNQAASLAAFWLSQHRTADKIEVVLSCAD